MTNLVTRAKAFAALAHAGAVRKFGPPEPYLNHVERVAATVAATGAHENVVAAALLHDTVEDTKVEFIDLVNAFPATVADMVLALTNVPPTPGLNRADRHALDVKRLAAANADVHTIKLADLIDNTGTIVDHAKPAFAKLYLTEKAALLAVLTKGDPALHARATATLAAAFNKLATTS